MIRSNLPTAMSKQTTEKEGWEVAAVVAAAASAVVAAAASAWPSSSA